MSRRSHVLFLCLLRLFRIEVFSMLWGGGGVRNKGSSIFRAEVDESKEDKSS